MRRTIVRAWDWLIRLIQRGQCLTSTRPYTTSTLLLLTGITLLGAGLRLWGACDRGLGSYDEGGNWLEGRFCYEALLHLPALPGELKGLMKSRHESRQDPSPEQPMTKALPSSAAYIPPTGAYARPMHAFLIALGMLLVGPTDYASTLVCAFFGTLTIPVVYFLGKQLYDRRTGLLAALFLSVLGYHVVYSRQGLAEADSLFFFTVALLCYVKCRQAAAAHVWVPLACSGLFCGLTFVTLDRWLIAFGLFWLYELQAWLSRSIGFLTLGKRLVLFHACSAIPLVLCELPYHFGLLLSHARHELYRGNTYWEQLALRYLIQNMREKIRPDFGYFPQLFWLLAGPIFCLLLIGGLTAMCRRRRGLSDFIVATGFLVPLVAFSLIERHFMRLATLSLPAAALVAARPFHLLVVPSILGERLASRRASVALLTIVVVLTVTSEMWTTWKILPLMPSSYRETIDYLRERNALKHISTQPHVSESYAGRENVAWPPKDNAELRMLYDQGFRYYLVCPQKYGWERRGMTDDIAKKVPPMVAIRNPFTGSFLFAYEQGWWTRALLNAPRSEVEEVRVFDLQQYFASPTTE
jgi:hypothetical protein